VPRDHAPGIRVAIHPRYQAVRRPGRSGREVVDQLTERHRSAVTFGDLEEDPETAFDQRIDR